MKNLVGRELPEFIEGYGLVKPFNGAFSTMPDMNRYAPKVKCSLPTQDKILEDLETVFKNIPIVDGMTLGFHHHFRNGDFVVNKVMAVAHKLNIKNLTIALSSIFPIHAPLVDYMKDETVTQIDTNYMSGPVAQAISEGKLKKPAILRTHGGRARAIECGQLKVDVAFIAAPCVDTYGNINGVEGDVACGSLGYAFPDMEYAEHVVAVTNNILPYPLNRISIPQTRVGYIVKLDEIGDPKGIVSGTTTITKDPVQLKIASLAAKAIECSGLLKNGFSFQTGAGGASLAVAEYIRETMKEQNITGSFALGGITGYLVQMLEEGLFKNLLDVQGFDLEAVRSLRDNPNHIEIGAGMYANPFNSGCVVNQLDCVVLGATEMDTSFNVNVTTSSNGLIMGGSGGHSDTAAGAKLTIVTANLLRSRLPIIRDDIMAITTPGETVDVLVTEYGICVNPRRQDLVELYTQHKLPLLSIEAMKELAEKKAGKSQAAEVNKDRVVGILEYRDGTVIDLIYSIKNS